MFKLIVSVVFVLVVLRLGLALLRGLARAHPDPPPAGQLRKVRRRYRCTSCGVELTMTEAPDEDPPPPRHCMDEMQFVGSRDL